MTVLAVANQKGGVGKSTLAVNLAISAVADGRKVLIVDADPQASAVEFSEVRDSDRPRFDTIQMVRPILHQELPHITAPYDLAIIDVGGRDSATFRSALVAASVILVPLGPSAADLWATQDVFQLLDEVSITSPKRSMAVFTRVVHGTKVAREADNEVDEVLKDHLVAMLDTVIHSRVAWAQSFGEGLAVSEFDPKGAAALELATLYKELQL